MPKIAVVALFALFLSALPAQAGDREWGQPCASGDDCMSGYCNEGRCAGMTVCHNGMMAIGRGTFTDIWSTWQGVVVTAVLVIFLISAMVYALAGVVSHRGLRVWAQNQIYEGFATLVIGMFIVGLVSWICGIDAGVIGAHCPDGSNLFVCANSYLMQFESEVHMAWYAIALTNMLLAAFSTWSFYVGAGGLGTALSMGSGFGQISSSLGSALIAVSVVDVLVLTQMQVLRISEIMFGYLLPTGIILRAFGATRGIGGALMAVSLGFYFMYPVGIVLMYGLLLNNVQNQVQEMPMGGNDMSSWQSESGGFFGQMCGMIGTLCVGGAIIPFIVFILVVSFTKTLSSQLGEEIDVSNLTRLV